MYSHCWVNALLCLDLVDILIFYMSCSIWLLVKIMFVSVRYCLM